jgi:putative flippase GtrA
MVDEILTHSHPRRIATFVGIGAINTAIDILAFAGLYGLGGLHVVPANVLAFLIAVANSYAMNYLFTFADRRSGRGTLRGFAWFLSVAVVAMCVSTAIVYLISMITHPMIAKLVATVASTAINYVGCYRFVFPADGSGLPERSK